MELSKAAQVMLLGRCEAVFQITCGTNDSHHDSAVLRRAVFSAIRAC